MPLLEAGRLVPDSYLRVEDEAPLPDSAPAIVSFARLERDAASLAGRNAPLGVILPQGLDPETLAPYLDRLALVVVQLPKFKDGRAFTMARTLRERYGYKGEIRATGHILPDQYVLLLRVGVNSVEVADGVDPKRWQEAMGIYHIAYQAALSDDTPLSNFRRRLATAEGR
jgi:uncharacterized protein (DUF934 family)